MLLCRNSSEIQGLKIEVAAKRKHTAEKKRKPPDSSYRLFITVDCALFFPVLLVTTIDPDMKTIPAWIHVLALYLKMSSYTVNSLVYSVLNKKMKSSFLNIVRCFFPNKKNSADLTKTATQQTPYSN